MTSSDKTTKRLLTVGACLLVLGIGVTIAIVLKMSRPRLQPKKPANVGTPVEVLVASRSNQKTYIDAMGTVIPSRELEIQSEVSGLITMLSPRLIPGSIISDISKPFCKIDTRNYQALLEGSRAQVAQAQLALKTEIARGEIAAKEWLLAAGETIIQKGKISTDVKSAHINKDLALRKPQLAQAKAALKAAESALAKAELDMQRTSLYVPFPVVVRDEFVEIGQLLTPQTRLARLAGIDSFRVKCSLPADTLSLIALPDKNRPGASARILREKRLSATGTIEKSWLPAKVIQLLPDLDPAGRMARLLVEVPDPMGLKGNAQNPLLLGSYVKVRIDGPELKNVITLPRKVLHEGNIIWIMDKKGLLATQRVTVVWKTRDQVMISSGIESGQRVVVTNFSGAYPGMKLRLPSKSDRNAKR
jgi:RND family efflux transporter MFP subunit